jgi:GAF domain-containing protein
MSQLVVDMFFAIFFVLLLILLFKLRERVFGDDRDSFKCSFFGIAILFAASVFRLINHQGGFNAVPFLSESLYCDLIEAIGIVTGITLMVAGVSIWLPTKKNTDKAAAETYVKHKKVLRIIREIDESAEIEPLFDTIPASVCDCFGFAAAAVLRFNHKVNRFLYTNGHNLSSRLSRLLPDYAPQLPREGDSLDAIMQKVEPDYCLRLRLEDKPKAAVFFWKMKSMSLSIEEGNMLEDLEAAFSRRLRTHFLSGKAGYFAKSGQCLLRVGEMAASSRDLAGNMPYLHGIFSDAVGAEYISLAIMDKYDFNMRRFTVGKNRKVLLENGSSFPLENTQVETVRRNRKGLLISDVTAAGGLPVDTLFVSCGLKSLISVPISNRGRLIAVLTAGNSRPGYFTKRDLTRAEMIALALTPAVEYEIASRATFEKDSYLGAIMAFDGAVAGCRDVDNLLQAAGKTLIDNISTTLVRITALNSRGDELVTKVVRTIRPSYSIKTDDVAVSPESIPCHWAALHDKRPQGINQNDPDTRMDEPELRALVMEGARSALIVPVVVDDVTYGLITLGEMRHPERFRYDPATIVFCRNIALKTAAAIKRYKTPPSQGQSGIGQYAVSPGVDRMDAYREIRPLLTNMVGEIELLHLKGTGLGDASGRIVDSLKRSADEVVTVVNRE